jgi:hypothetical protein
MALWSLQRAGTYAAHIVLTASTSDEQEVRAPLTVRFTTERDEALARVTASRIVDLLRPAFERATLEDLIGTERELCEATLGRARAMDATVEGLELGRPYSVGLVASGMRRRLPPTVELPRVAAPAQPPQPRAPEPAMPEGVATVTPLVRQATRDLAARAVRILLDERDARGARVETEIHAFSAFALFDELVSAGLGAPAAARFLEAAAAGAFRDGVARGIAAYLHPVQPSPELELASRLTALCDAPEAADLLLALLASHRAQLRAAAGFARGLAR